MKKALLIGTFALLSNVMWSQTLYGEISYGIGTGVLNTVHYEQDLNKKEVHVKNLFQPNLATSITYNFIPEFGIKAGISLAKLKQVVSINYPEAAISATAKYNYTQIELDAGPDFMISLSDKLKLNWFIGISGVYLTPDLFETSLTTPDTLTYSNVHHLFKTSSQRNLNIAVTSALNFQFKISPSSFLGVRIKGFSGFRNWYNKEFHYTYSINDRQQFFYRGKYFAFQLAYKYLITSLDENPVPFNLDKLNNAYLEIGGAAGSLSLNYEKIIRTGTAYAIGGRTGFGIQASPSDIVEGFAIPFSIVNLFGTKTTFLEIDAGVSFNWEKLGFPASTQKFVKWTDFKTGIGFRYIHPNTFWMFRSIYYPTVNFTQLNDGFPAYFSHRFGISLGRSF